MKINAAPADQLGSAASEDIRFFQKGDPDNPTPGKKGFWQLDPFEQMPPRFLGTTFIEAYSSLFGGYPEKEIDLALFESIKKIVFFSRSRLGSKMVGAILAGFPYERWLIDLSPRQRHQLLSKSRSLGFIHSPADLYFEVERMLNLNEEMERGSTENPPMMVKASLKTGPAKIEVDTWSGQVLFAPGKLAPLESLYSGPGFGLQRAILQDRKLVEKRIDFTTPKEAWSQFREFNTGIQQQLYAIQGEGAVGGELFQEDKKGVFLEHISNYFERPQKLKNIEEAVKFVVRKLKIKKWDDFPIELFKENRDLWWLQKPDPAFIFTFSKGKRGYLPDHRIIPEIDEKQLDMEFSRTTRESEERFQALRDSFLIVESNKEIMEETDYKDAMNRLNQVIIDMLPFGDSDKADFVEYVRSVKKI